MPGLEYVSSKALTALTLYYTRRASPSGDVFEKKIYTLNFWYFRKQMIFWFLIRHVETLFLIFLIYIIWSLYIIMHVLLWFVYNYYLCIMYVLFIYLLLLLLLLIKCCLHAGPITRSCYTWVIKKKLCKKPVICCKKSVNCYGRPGYLLKKGR